MTDPGLSHLHDDGGYDPGIFGVLASNDDLPVLSSMDDFYPTDQARDIFQRLLPEWSDLFLLKNSKYKNVDNALGAAGVFPDLYRKMGVLKTRLWEGQEVKGIDEDDDTRRVVLDMIGHLFLMLHMMDEENGRA